MSQNKGRNSHQKRELKAELFGTRTLVKCCFCKARIGFETATLEHITPLCDGGTWSKHNLTLSCKACNQDRGNIDFQTYQKWRREHPNSKYPFQENSLRGKSIHEILDTLSLNKTK